MNQNDSFFIAGILAIITLLVGVDLIIDMHEGVALWHVLIEATIGIVALITMFYVLRDSILIKQELEIQRNDFSEFKKEAQAWRSESKKFIQGLSNAIDQQLTKWNLSPAEKDVAFLLLKGLSLKEIATARNTKEKTARVQAMAIYAKSGLAGRSELSAFFLEDLLMPQN